MISRRARRTNAREECVRARACVLAHRRPNTHTSPCARRAHTLAASVRCAHACSSSESAWSPGVPGPDPGGASGPGPAPPCPAGSPESAQAASAQPQADSETARAGIQVGPGEGARAGRGWPHWQCKLLWNLSMHSPPPGGGGGGGGSSFPSQLESSFQEQINPTV